MYCSTRAIKVIFNESCPLAQVWVARNPPGFAFVWFADDRDATDAVREIDGRSIAGREWRVEIVSREQPPQLYHAKPNLKTPCLLSSVFVCPGGGCFAFVLGGTPPPLPLLSLVLFAFVVACACFLHSELKHTPNLGVGRPQPTGLRVRLVR